MMRDIRLFIKSIMPGIFLIGYNIGTGSITSMSKAGANFGLDLLWAVLVSCLITYYLISLFSRYTMATGKTIIQGIKHDIHAALAVGLIISLSCIILVALVGVLGIIVDVINVLIVNVLGLNISSNVLAIIVSTFLYTILWFGNYEKLKKILAILVSLMGIAFISSMLFYFPEYTDVLKGFIPKIPATAAGSDNNPFVIIAGMVGTTISIFVFIIRSQMIQHVGWNMNKFSRQRRDALISTSIMFLISMAVLVTSANTLHIQGLKMNSVVEMIVMLQPIAGDAAIFIFVLGVLAAGFSSHLPNLLVIPWLLQDYEEKKLELQNKRTRIIIFILVTISTIGVVTGIKSVFIMMLSQACLTIVLPITLACTFYLTSKEKYMGNYVNKKTDFVFMALIMLFVLYMSSLGIEGLLNDLSNI
jgi:Mn2+/Fe2+ NRAMP family transporter